MPLTSAHHGERYFLTLLHCFIIHETSMNAAGPAPGGLLRIHDCSVGDVYLLSW